MKIQLDTTNKTIKLEDNVSLKEFVSKIKKLLPNNEWQQFTLETNTTITYWSNPIIFKTYPLWEREPLTRPWYVIQGTSADYSLKAGTYNVEC